MRNRSEASILGGRRHIVVVAALVTSLLVLLMYALANAAWAQDTGGGGVNIQASNCSQVQAIFIRQFLVNFGNSAVASPTASSTATSTASSTATSTASSTATST